MNKQLKNVPEGNKGLKKLPTDVRNKMGYMAKGGAVMKAKGGSVKMAKGGSVKMAKGGAVMGGMAGMAGMAEGLKKKQPKDLPIRGRTKPTEKQKEKSMNMAGGGMAKGYKAGGMMAKGYKAGGVATKGGTKGGVSGGTKVTRADGIAKRGKTKGRKV